MICLSCNHKRSLCENNDHHFYYGKDGYWFFDLKKNNKLFVTVGYCPKGYYIMFIPKLNVNIISEFKMSDSLTLIDKYLKLKAFI